MLCNECSRRSRTPPPRAVGLEPGQTRSAIIDRRCLDRIGFNATRARLSAVHGELPEDGLAGYGVTGDKLMMAVAHKLVWGEADNAPVEDIFRQTQQIADQADLLLIDGD
jgi:hypothetical protein